MQDLENGKKKKKKTRKMWKMGHKQYMSWNMGRNSEKRGKCEMLTVGPRMWQEKMIIMENEKCIQQDLEFEEKREKRGK